MEDEQLLKKRFLDLSKQADRKGIVTFSDFLNSNEQNIFHQVEQTLFCRYEMNGGYENAERNHITPEIFHAMAGNVLTD